MFTDTDRDDAFPALLVSARAGGQAALDQIFRTYHPRLLRYLRAQQQPTVTDDLAAETWLAVARGLARFRGDEAGFRAWLFTIARRRLVEHHRREVRRRTEPLPPDRLDRPVEWGWGGDPAAIALDRLGAQQAVALLVADLTPDQAEAVLLRVVAGLDVAEVAGIMGRSPGSVRVLCHRALARLATSAGSQVATEPRGTPTPDLGGGVTDGASRAI